MINNCLVGWGWCINIGNIYYENAYTDIDIDTNRVSAVQIAVNILALPFLTIKLPLIKSVMHMHDIMEYKKLQNAIIIICNVDIIYNLID